MTVTQYGTTFTTQSVTAIAVGRNGDLAIYDYGVDGGSIYTLHNGVYTELVGNLTASLGGQEQSLTILSDGAYLLYRQDFEAGGASFAIVNADGSVRTTQTEAYTNGDGQGNNEDIRGPSAAATTNGGFVFGVTDGTYVNSTVTGTFTDDDGTSNTYQVGRSSDVSHRVYTSTGQAAGPFKFDNTGLYNNGGTTTDHTAGNQSLASTLTLANGSVLEVYFDQEFFEQHGNNNNSQTVITGRFVRPNGVTSGPIQLSADPLTSSDFNPLSHRIDGTGGVQLVSLGTAGFAAIYEQRSEVPDSSVYGGYRTTGYDTIVRYFDQTGQALTDGIQILHRGLRQDTPLSVGAAALANGRIAVLFGSGPGGVNGNGGGQLFIETVGSMGSSLSVAAITPPPVNGVHIENFDLKSLGGNNVAVTYSNSQASSSYVKTYTIGASTGSVQFGTDNADTETGTASEDDLSGGNGNDSLVGGAGNDLLDGGLGNDTLNGGAGIDQMAGGLGDDAYVVDNPADRVIENDGEGRDTVYASTSWSAGTAEVEVIRANAGSTGLHLTGSYHNDTLVGLSGADTLDGGGGTDTLQGGAGDDSYIVNNAGVTVTEGAGGGTDTVLTTLSSYTLGANIENLTYSGSGNLAGTGNNLANVLTGGSGNDALNGGLGADTMVGGFGDDTYVVDNVGDVVTEASGAGADLVRSTISDTLGDDVENLTLLGTGAIDGTGNALANRIVGNGGANTLDGGAGTDTLTGGSGNDTFVFHAGEANGDTVTDFTGAGAPVGDVLTFEGYGAGSISRIGSSSNYRITPDAAHGGSAAAETIHLLGVSTLDVQQGAGHNDIVFA